MADEVISDLQLEADSVFLAQGNSLSLSLSHLSLSIVIFFLSVCAGTLRPDLIESASPLASARAHVIKTHHNDTQLVRELRRKVTTLSLSLFSCCFFILCGE